MKLPFPRRQFLFTLTAAGAALALPVRAQTMVDETSAQAGAIGYVADAKKTDTKKHPKYATGQNCSNCALYQGKVTDKAGACALFPGKQVAGAGWCNAWAKKA